MVDVHAELETVRCFLPVRDELLEQELSGQDADERHVVEIGQVAIAGVRMGLAFGAQPLDRHRVEDVGGADACT